MICVTECFVCHMLQPVSSVSSRDSSLSLSLSLCAVSSLTLATPSPTSSPTTKARRSQMVSAGLSCQHHSSKHGCFKCSKVLFFNSSIKSINLIINKSQVINDINKYYLYFNVCNHFFILVGLIFLLNNKLI